MPNITENPHSDVGMRNCYGADGHINVSIAQKVLDQFNERYLSLQQHIGIEYEKIVGNFKLEWQGPSAYDYLKKLAERLDILRSDLSILANTTSKVLGESVNSILVFEESNTKDGTADGSLGRVTYYVNNIPDALPVYDLNEFIGLKVKDDGNVRPEYAKKIIGEAITSAVNNIKRESDSLYNQAKQETNQAIHSEETRKEMNYFFERFKDISGTIGTAVQDFYDALDVLLVTNYKNIDTSTANAIHEVVASANNINVGKSRWNMEK